MVSTLPQCKKNARPKSDCAIAKSGLGLHFSRYMGHHTLFDDTYSFSINVFMHDNILDKKIVYSGIMPYCITELQRKRDRQTFELFFSFRD